MQVSTPLHRLHQHKEAVFRVGWLPQSTSHFASGGDDGFLYLWDLLRVAMHQVCITQSRPNMACIRQSEYFTCKTVKAEYGTYKTVKHFASGGDDGFLYLWDLSRIAMHQVHVRQSRLNMARIRQSRPNIRHM